MTGNQNWKRAEHSRLPVADWSTAGWQPQDKMPIARDITLRGLAQGVVEHPKGAQAGQLTKSISQALQHRGAGYTLRDHERRVTEGLE